MNQKNYHIAKIKVIGVGGGGGNAVNRMIEDGVNGVEFIVANTDLQDLYKSPVENKIVLGEKLTKGLGAGAKPNIGREAALEAEPQLKKALEGADLIFLAAGMGGGTGTGAAPVVARIAKETGALVVAIVTKPFKWEGKNRTIFAMDGIDELRKNVDSIIVISNDRLRQIGGTLPVMKAFKEADNILKQGVQAITDLTAVPAIMNVDFADVRTIMEGQGNAIFGIGIGRGPNKVIEATNKAVTSSLLETSIYGAKNALINITGGVNHSLEDAEDVIDIINQAAGVELDPIIGFSVNEHLDDEIIVTIIATGFDDNYNPISESATGSAHQQNSQSHHQAENVETVYDKRTSFMESRDDKRPSFVRESQPEQFQGGNHEDTTEEAPIVRKIDDTVDDEEDDLFSNNDWI
ncbi:cell division protein FtsZ [Spiroplasma clarkii]|uniref:Cell division protein FtsZ n=1 Tax=Spiroplasma clarkii TaxID=2139 RepID=A0A1Y0L082_9MOLU|nr:cell division protein FtsZ [Spiroplasma clarkii]ARU91407.1 cell division protein FtsZ [Spiroplasma clarkii]ATX70823.1 cell division protein FtsZ [Spiroplasma clarkii]